MSQAQYRQLKSFPTGNGLKVRRSHIHGWGLFACDEFQKGAGAYIAGVRIIHTYTQRCFFVGVSFCTVKIKNGKTGLAAISLPSLCCSCCDIIYFFCAGKVQNKQIRRYIAVRSFFFFFVLLETLSLQKLRVSLIPIAERAAVSSTVSCGSCAVSFCTVSSARHLMHASRDVFCVAPA